ncbi:MAG TPA: restriction endonuclease [Pyrinomonadaceae bacterium]|jgi:site-specific DNA-methyltransferase (cytosine-N4-specific)
MATKETRRFTYGDQFEQSKTPLLDLLKICRDYSPDLAAMQEQIRTTYFPGHGSEGNSNTMAMNCRLSLKAYRLIETDRERGATRYTVTPLASELIELAEREGENAMFRRFAVHILTNLFGMTLLRLIENIRARGEQVSLEYLGEEMNDLGIKIAPNSTYISTMVAWLAKAGVITETGYSVNWDVVYDLLKTDAELIDKLHELTLEQRFFMLSMLSLATTDFVASNKIANHTRSVYSVRLTSKNLVKDVLEPLEAAGLIETQKTTTGRGAKPHDIRLADKGKNELLLPMLENLAEITELTSADLNKPFEDVVKDLDHSEKHVRGIALELFAVWIIRLLGLRFSKWRLRSFQATGGAEVDVMAASDKIVYSRWQMQCKNTKSKVTVDTVAKEVGLNFLTQADVIALITTGSFTGDAVNYANQVTDNSRYYVILLDGEDIKRIVADRTKIVDILNVKARRVFAKKELGLTDFADEMDEADFEEELAEEVEPVLREAMTEQENGETQN